MKSPWQLIKNLTSRRKTKDAGEDAAASTADAGDQDAVEVGTAQSVSSAAKESTLVSSAEISQPIEQVRLPEPAADEPHPLLRPDSLPLEPISEDAAHAGDQSSAAPIVQPRAPEANVGAAATEQEERQAEAGPTQKHVSKHAVVPKATARPEAKKTALEETIELDREINELRSVLSAKLLKQNRQLRRMLERYDER